MSESSSNDPPQGRAPARDQKTYADLGAQIQDLLVGANLMSAEDRPADEAQDLGRLAIAFIGLADQRIRGALIALMETVSRN